MPSEILQLAAQIVMSHASTTELTPAELVKELKEIYSVLIAFKGSGVEEELISSQNLEAMAEGVQKPLIALNQIVRAKYGQVK